ncbi:hypothetical protein B0H10DRAFT_1139033 [Mycena sp. CBHHK59/15]|nr:hypothetical protein B0H10DRAFT_1139033 [Mycena sp. CBHHK59/15]
MEVSKLHATAYWDNAWHIVDMGSKHGTFIQPASSTATVRLSPPRVASVPRRLRHFDTLSIASTTFVVHIHEDRLPCAECCSTTQNEIPLFLSQKRKVSNVVPTPDTAGYLANARDPKKALTMLKHRLLVNTAEQSHVGKEVTSYLDRSARRRSLYPTSRLDSPGVVVVPRVGPSASPSQPPPLVTPAWMPPPAVTRSQPSVPLPNTNIGHRLLMAQGWTPGSSLGASQDGNEGRIALTAPLEVASTAHRAGLGMAKLTAASWDSRRRGQAERDT